MTLVDGWIERHFEELEAAKEKEAQRAVRIRKQAEQAIVGVRADLKRAVDRRSKLAEESWSLEGDVFELDVEGMEKVLLEAEGILQGEPSGVYLVEPKLRPVRSQLSAWQAGVDRFLKDEGRLKILHQTVSKAQFESPEAKQTLKAASGVADDALKFYREGDTRYFLSYENANRLLRTASKEEEHYHEVRQMTLVGVGVGIAFLGILGIWGNRSRRRIKKEAETLLESRRKEMKEIVDDLFEVMDRASVVVGPADELEKRGYEGETLKLSQEALRGIDEAFVLSSRVQRIVKEAEGLVHTKNPWSWSRNLVSGGLYARAVDLLDEELVCQPDEGSVLVSEERGEERERSGMDDEAFSVPIDAWKGKTEEALDKVEDCLDEVDEAWSTIIDRCEELKKGIIRLEEMEPHFEGVNWLRCLPVFNEWIDAMEEAFDQGVRVGANDPVLALRDSVSQGDRMVGDAGKLLENILWFLDQRWASLEEGEEELKNRGRQVTWIEGYLDQYCDLIHEIVEEGIEEPVMDRIEELDFYMIGFGHNLDSCVAFAKQADEECLPNIEEAEKMVRKARRELAQALKLEEDSVLREEGKHPGESLEEARNSLAEALLHLDAGRVDEAGDSLSYIEQMVEQAHHLVSGSREVFT